MLDLFARRNNDMGGGGADHADAASWYAPPARVGMHDSSGAHSQAAGATVETDLQTAGELTDSRLLTCRGVGNALGATIDALSAAGSLLQRISADVSLDGVALNAIIGSDDPSMCQGVGSMLTACGGIGVTLIGLAARLSGEILRPLEDLQRDVRSDRLKLKVKMADLRRQKAMLSVSLEDAGKRKAKASAELQGAVKLQEGLDDDTSRKGLVWPLKKQGPTRKDRSEAESRLQRAAFDQTTAVEELADHTEKISAVQDAVDCCSGALLDIFAYVDPARKQTIRNLLLKCGVVWDEVGRHFQAASEQMREQSRELTIPWDRLVPNAPQVAPPVWASALLETHMGETQVVPDVVSGSALHHAATFAPEIKRAGRVEPLAASPAASPTSRLESLRTSISRGSAGSGRSPTISPREPRAPFSNPFDDGLGTASPNSILPRRVSSSFSNPFDDGFGDDQVERSDLAVDMHELDRLCDLVELVDQVTPLSPLQESGSEATQSPDRQHCT